MDVGNVGMYIFIVACSIAINIHRKILFYYVYENNMKKTPEIKISCI